VIRAFPSKWRAAVIICAKCEKKLGGGFGPGGKTGLSKMLRLLAGGGKGRKAGFGVVSTKCLKICPKKAVTVVSGSRPHEFLVVPAGEPIELVTGRLGLS
jgi:predicted metal-binding protein